MKQFLAVLFLITIFWVARQFDLNRPNSVLAMEDLPYLAVSQSEGLGIDGDLDILTYSNIIYLAPNKIPEKNQTLVLDDYIANQGYSRCVTAFGKDQWKYFYELVHRESGWRINAINPTSGACGLPQALPCAKMGCSLSDHGCQLDWMIKYIINRYGTPEKAIYFHNLNNWY